MENQSKKVIADAVECSRPTTVEVNEALGNYASVVSDFDSAGETLCGVLLKHFGYVITESGEVTEHGYAWFNQVGDSIQKATDPDGKALKKFRDILYVSLHEKARAKAKLKNPNISDAELKKVKYSNASNRFEQIKAIAREIVEGKRLPGKGGSPKKTLTELAIRDGHPIWARFAREEELTDREMKIMKAADALIRACGHDPQKVDLKALGLKK